MRSSLYALAGGASTALAAVRGFNYASQGQTYDSFVAQFQAAASLVGADDFTSARLYTMIQESTSNTVISAIPAAIATNTTLLLGLWASEDQAAFSNELTALTNAIDQYGSEFADLVVGISVGSEDLYRNSPTGIAADSGYGQEPDVIVDYIGQTRTLIEGTILGSKPVGHVDTWSDFVNGSNAAVVAACDFIGLDEYPFYQTADDNTVENGKSLFFEAYDKVVAVAGGIPVWITESGWPTVGSTTGNAVASVDNAETYWQDVACELITRGIDFWWYILIDSGANPSFGVVDTLGGAPLYDLSCSASSSSSSSASASATSSASVSSVAQATTPSSAAASTTVAFSNPIPSAGIASSVGSAGVSSAAASVSAALNGSAVAEPVVYVTDVATTYVTTCPVGYTLTANGSTTVLATASVITTTSAVQTTITSQVGAGAVPAGTGVVASGTGVAASGTGAAGAYAGASTLASTWGAGQTPSASVSAYTGAAAPTKMAGSAALALGAVVAVFAL